MEFSHIPVLFNETINALDIKQNGIYIDGTAGGGGHSLAIADKSPCGLLLAIDQDPDAIDVLTRKFKYYSNVIVCQSNFANMGEVAKELKIEKKVDGVLLDIGVSSHQLDTPERGFSFHTDAPLDMRMSQEGISAKDLVNSLSWRELAEIISMYGEEKFAVSIAKAIEKEREVSPIETTLQLSEIIKNAVPAAVRRDGHPARKTFQALRIAVNAELDKLTEGLHTAFSLLKPGGRLAVITFHSLEDRIVKKTMAEWCKGCTCPPDFPICICGNTPKAKLFSKKPIEATKEELENNPRSRSAKLRVCIKL